MFVPAYFGFFFSLKVKARPNTLIYIKVLKIISSLFLRLKDENKELIKSSSEYLFYSLCGAFLATTILRIPSTDLSCISFSKINSFPPFLYVRAPAAFLWNNDAAFFYCSHNIEILMLNNIFLLLRKFP